MILLPRRWFWLLPVATLATACNAAVVSGWGGDFMHIDDPEDVRVGDDASTGAPSRPSSEEVVFRPHIHEDLVEEGCVDCHQRASTPMRIVAEPSSDAEWRDNYDEVTARAASELIGKATGAGGHGAFLDATSPVLARWRTWIDADTPYESEEEDPAPDPTEHDAGTGAVDAGSRPPPTGGASVTYTNDVQPIIEANGCSRCHDPAPSRAGGYDLSDFAGIMGAGSDDVPNVVPGDADSVLVDYVRNGHQGIGYLEALTVMEWVVDWEARRD